MNSNHQTSRNFKIISYFLYFISGPDRYSSPLNFIEFRFIISILKWECEDSKEEMWEMDREKKTGKRLGPASTYLPAFSGKPWPRTQSRPLMSPTNFQCVLQAESGIFWPWYMPFPLCLLPWQGLKLKSMPKSPSLKLLCSMASTTMLMIPRLFLLTS